VDLTKVSKFNEGIIIDRGIMLRPTAKDASLAVKGLDNPWIEKKLEDSEKHSKAYIKAQENERKVRTELPEFNLKKSSLKIKDDLKKSKKKKKKVSFNNYANFREFRYNDTGENWKECDVNVKFNGEKGRYWRHKIGKARSEGRWLNEHDDGNFVFDFRC
jgi:hypothetical protein